MAINVQGRDFTEPAVQGVSQVTGNIDINCRDTFAPIVQVGYTSKLDAENPPTANDDLANTSGNGIFQVGSFWVDTANGEAYTCIDATATAAVWVNTTFEASDLGSLALLNSINNSNWSGTDLAVANGGTGASDAATARTNLGVDAAGTDNAPSASTTTPGKIEIATQAEVDAGSDTVRAVTPATLANYSGLGGVTVLDEDDMASNSAAAVPSQQSVKAYVDGKVVGLYTHKGSYNAATNSPDLDNSPSGILKGYAYTVSADGNFFAVEVQVGDVLIADQENPTQASHWTILNKNIPDLGTLAVLNSVNNSNWAGTDLSILNGGTGASDAAGARTNLGVDAAGTDNSTPVTLTGTPDYITISGQTITRGLIDLASDITGTLPVAQGGTGSTTVAGARSALGVDAAGTDNSPSASTTMAGKIEIATQAEVDTGSDTQRAVTPSTLGSWSGRYSHPNHTGDVTSTGDGATSITAGAVTSSKIADNAVTTSKILNANVTTAKLVDDAVTTSKILNSNVTYGKIQNVSATDMLLGRSTAGAGTVEEIACTAAGRALLDDADASAQRTTLGLGSLATASTINDGNWSGTDLAVANGGTGASDAATARANLGISSGAVTLIASATASNHATIDFTDASLFDGTYNRIEVFIAGIRPESGQYVGLLMRVRQGGTWKSDGGYHSAGAIAATGITSISSIATTSGTGLGSGYGYPFGSSYPAAAGQTSSDEAIHVWEFGGNYGTSGKTRMFMGRMAHRHYSTGITSANFCGAYFTSTDAIDGIRFLYQTGNIPVGTFHVYGIA